MLSLFQALSSSKSRFSVFQHQLARRNYATHRPSRNAKRLQISRALSFVLRHGGRSNGLDIRDDGFVRVKELLRHPLLQNVDFTALEDVVRRDRKSRFTLAYRLPDSNEPDVWWIRANQGHSISVADLELRRISSPDEIPMAVHGTTEEAWTSISLQGLSRMGRNHIHMAQGVAGKGVVSGIRQSSRILIYIDLAKAMSAGIKFYLSSNGVVLTPGDKFGFLGTEFFRRVERVTRQTGPIPGWEGTGTDPDPVIAAPNADEIFEEGWGIPISFEDPTSSPGETPRRKVQDEITLI